MKKAISLILCLVMSFSFFAVFGSAAGNAVIAVNSVTARKGETVNVQLKLTSNPGIAYLRITMDYGDKLTLVSVENGSIINDFDNGLNLVWSADNNSTKTGVLATLKFAVAGDAPLADIAVNVKCRECYDSQMNDVSVSVTAGKVTVTDKKGYEDAVISAPSGEKTVKWKYHATVNATAKLPEGYSLKWYQNQTPCANQSAIANGVSITTEELKSDMTLTVKIVDSNGKIVSSSSQEKTVTLKVDSGFVTKLISFFTKLFKKNFVTI